MIENKKLILDSKLTNYLDEEQVKNLCQIKGLDHSKVISIKDLIYQTSGIPDYFDGNVKPFISKMDLSYTFEDKLKWTKQISGINKPGKVAYYSNLNIDLLAYILEKTNGKNLMEVYNEYIIYPLGLKNTYIPMDNDVYIPALFFDGKPLKRPKLIKSSYGSGGLISTARDLMKFMIAFFDGRLFEKSLIEKLTVFNSMENGYGNILYGGGLMKLKSKKLILGQMGYSGAFAFADPERRIYLTGYMSQDGVQQVLPKMITEIFEKI
jgi:CubicO group peptidase (beta-lactamase class C family)